MKIFALLGVVSAWPLVSRQTNSSIPATMATSSNSTTNGTMSSNSTMTNSTIDMSSSAMQLLYCNATNQRYVPAIYVCFPTALCKVGLMACGVACYDPRMYGCLNGALFQVGMLPVDVGNPNVAVVAAPSTSTSSGNTTMTVMASNGTMSGNSTM